MRRASTIPNSYEFSSHTQSHFPYIPSRPTEPKPLLKTIFGWLLYHLSYKIFRIWRDLKPRHTTRLFSMNFQILDKDKTIYLICQTFFNFFSGFGKECPRLPIFMCGLTLLKFVIGGGIEPPARCCSNTCSTYWATTINYRINTH